MIAEAREFEELSGKIVKPSIKNCMNDKISSNKKDCLPTEYTEENIEKIKTSLKNKEEFNKYLKQNNFPENFELLNYVDSGSESNVYHMLISKKKNDKIKKNVIMKVIFHSKKQKINKKEIYISTILKNNNIVDFYGYSKLEENKTSYMLTEFAKYGNLRNFQKKTIKRQYLSESIICFFAYQILNGIYYCHKCKVAHMDIKPQNVVIDDFLNAKLIDFSISLNYRNRKPEEQIQLPFRGTNFFMCMQIIRSENIKIKDLAKVDLYSFGVMLYNMAFSCYPYKLSKGEEENYEIILEKIEKNKLVFPNTSDYSPYFLDFISRLLEKDINKRMNLGEAMNHFWIKGAKILLEEKEKIYNVGIFVSYLLTDHIREFNNYIKQQNQGILEKT